MRESDAVDNNTEQSQESTQPPTIVSRSELTDVHALASQLINVLHEVPEGDLVGEIVASALKLLRDQTNRGDIKLIDKSLKELRYALKVFAPYRDIRKVSIFGSARTREEHPDYQQAAKFAHLMAEAGWMVITGAGGGIMAAGHGGAGAEPSFGLSIRLPFEQKTNVFIENDPKLINFKYFFTRKLMFVRSSHGIALFPGGFGTMDEGFEVLTLIQTGKSIPTPIVFIENESGTFWRGWQEYIEKHLLPNGLIGTNDLALYKITRSVEEAVAEFRHFYSNYHSLRFVRDEVAMRIHHAPSEEQLRKISEDFRDIVSRGQFRVSAALPLERDEPTLAHLPRLVFAFNRKDHARLRMLIDRLNEITEEKH